MAIHVKERSDSRSSREGNTREAAIKYDIWGTSNNLLVKALLASSSPPVYDGLNRLTWEIEPNGADDIWIGNVRYGEEKTRSLGLQKWSFDTSGGTEHITQSLATIERYAPLGKTAPNHKGAIGVTSDGVDGVDVRSRGLKWVETHRFDRSMIPWGYGFTLYALTTTYNNAPFRGFAVGEVLFNNASVGLQRGNDVDIDYHFEAIPNEYNLTIGDIEGVVKKGFDYIWVEYQKAKDDAANARVIRPKAAHVEQVYYAGDFSQLGIGTGIL